MSENLTKRMLERVLKRERERDNEQSSDVCGERSSKVVEENYGSSESGLHKAIECFSLDEPSSNKRAPNVGTTHFVTFLVTGFRLSRNVSSKREIDKRLVFFRRNGFHVLPCLALPLRT